MVSWWCPPSAEREFLDPLPVGLVWGIGPVTRQRLAERGIYTIGQLAASPDGALQSLLGQRPRYQGRRSRPTTTGAGYSRPAVPARSVPSPRSAAEMPRPS